MIKGQYHNVKKQFHSTAPKVSHYPEIEYRNKIVKTEAKL